MVRFSWLTGDVNWLDYGGKWISSKQNNGDWDYWLVLEILNWEDAVGEREAKEVGAKYNVSLAVVAPGAVPASEMQSAIRSAGWEGFDDSNPLMVVEMLHSHGLRACLYDVNGNNAAKLLRDAKREAQIITGITFGFAMDRQRNAIGNDGWDFVSGNIGFKKREQPANV